MWGHAVDHISKGNARNQPRERGRSSPTSMVLMEARSIPRTDTDSTEVVDADAMGRDTREQAQKGTRDRHMSDM